MLNCAVNKTKKQQQSAKESPTREAWLQEQTKLLNIRVSQAIRQRAKPSGGDEVKDSNLGQGSRFWCLVLHTVLHCCHCWPHLPEKVKGQASGEVLTSSPATTTHLPNWLSLFQNVLSTKFCSACLSHACMSPETHTSLKSGHTRCHLP